ncbi:hypothetical protein GWK47_002792 [Chionoecetes opilio]|uniref:Uncharacterized protein n=1 Tax=Chionoecetes opilio TaxID=41210 RepID=A0A8J4XKY6_CHIOP|nr:hypothetical protein GWK47_002792 [Chionoecetes opilio]
MPIPMLKGLHRGPGDRRSIGVGVGQASRVGPEPPPSSLVRKSWHAGSQLKSAASASSSRSTSPANGGSSFIPQPRSHGGRASLNEKHSKQTSCPAAGGVRPPPSPAQAARRPHASQGRKGHFQTWAEGPATPSQLPLGRWVTVCGSHASLPLIEFAARRGVTLRGSSVFRLPGP